jgi:hypothetical protein
VSDKTFQAALKANREASLYGGWLTKYQHIERLGSPEVEGLLDGIVTVQTKIDGANLTVAWDNEKGLIIASRNQAISVGGVPSVGFNGAVEYVLANHRFEEIVRHGYIIRAEHLVRHSISYTKENMGKPWVFDVQQMVDGAYLEPMEYEQMFDGYGISFIPVLAILDHPTVDDIVALVPGPDTFGAQQKEGVVVKRYNFVNQWGHTVWAKLVAADFKEKNKLAFGAGKKDGPEMRFAATVTDEDVMKVIHLVNEQHPATVRDMSQVLGMVWHDAFVDRLWRFVQKDKVQAFDFGTARRLVESKTREIALTYFNGGHNEHSI